MRRLTVFWKTAIFWAVIGFRENFTVKALKADYYIVPRTTSVFAILCACDCTERFQTWKVIFEFTYYYEEGLGAAASEIHFIQVPGIQVCMSVLLLCSYYGVRKNTDC